MSPAASPRGPAPIPCPALLAGALAATLLLPAPASAQSSDADEAEEIKAVLVDMWDAIETGDLERYASHVHPDFTSFAETARYLAEGKELELRGVRDWTERVEGVHTEMHQPRVTVRDNTAWITYYWTDSGTVRATGERVSSAGKSTRIFVKEDGRWLCIHGHYTLAP